MNKAHVCDNNSGVGGINENEENVSSFQEINVVQGVSQADKHTCAITSLALPEQLEQPLKQHYKHKLHNQKQNEEEEEKEQEWKRKIEHQLSSLDTSSANISNDNTHDYSNINHNKPLQRQEEQESSSFIHGISQNESIVPNTHEEHTSTQTQTPSSSYNISMQSSSSLLSSSYNISSAELNYKKERVQLHTSLIKCKRELSACKDKMNELNMQISTLEAEKNACQEELDAKVKQIESLQEQQLIWKAERVHLISLNEELHGERGELQRQLQEAWSMICDMYKSHGKSLSELEEQPLATHIRKIATTTSSDEYDKNKIVTENENSNTDVKADHLGKTQQLLLEPLISTLRDNIKQALNRFMQNKLVVHETCAEDIPTLLEKNENTEYTQKQQAENNTRITNNSLPRKLWHCQRDFNAFVNLIDKQFMQMENTIASLQHERQQKESMQIQKYELEKEKEESLYKLQNERMHINALQQVEVQQQQHIALKNATKHARRILLHAQESVERTENELQTRKFHLAELLHVSPEWNLIEHAIQHMHLSLSAMEASAIENVNSENNYKIGRHVSKYSKYIEKQEQTTTTSSKEKALQWSNVKSEIVESIHYVLTLLGTWRNFCERVAFTSRIDALRQLLDSSKWTKPTSTRTIYNEVNHVDVIAKTIMTLCECASHFVIKSKILTEERNALNRCTFLRKRKLESSELSTVMLNNATSFNKHWTTVKSRPQQQQQQQGRCRLKRVITIALFCAWWMRKYRVVKQIQKQNDSTTPSLPLCETQFLMSVPNVLTTEEHQCAKKYDTNVVSNNSNNSSNDITRSELSDAFATEVLEVILALDKRVQTALERNNTNI